VPTTHIVIQKHVPEVNTDAGYEFFRAGLRAAADLNNDSSFSGYELIVLGTRAASYEKNASVINDSRWQYNHWNPALVCRNYCSRK
jgi:hypothetical protein